MTNNKIMSALDLLDEVSVVDDAAPLEVVRIGQDTSFISIFTQHGLLAQRHFLDATDRYPRGYYACIGSQCPACSAGIKANQVLRLPVVDRVSATIKLLDVPTQRGAGKLLTELQPALKAEHPEKFIVHISRDRNFVYHVSLQAQNELDPEVAERIHSFAKRMDGGKVSLEVGLQVLSREEMLEHELIAKRLQLTGGVS